MRIVRKSLAKGAREAQGLVVIIDVFRAFSCAPLFFHFGAKRVILQADTNIAISLKRQNPEYILVGEVNEVPIEGSDLGNSPSEIVLRGEAFFKDRTVVHRTTSGVTGAYMAFDEASEVLLGSFLVAKATAKYIKRKRPGLVSLVAMGDRAKRKAPEDESCADYFEHLLTGSPYDSVKAMREVVFQATAQKFIQGKKSYLPREDPIFCLQRDLIDLVLAVKREDDHLVVSIEPCLIESPQ